MELIAGNVYEGKKKQKIGVFIPLWNDRQIVYIDEVTEQVQWDSPSVKIGQRRKWSSFEAFRKWARRDITDEMPDGEWRTAS